MRLYFTRHGESQANLLHEISNRGLRYGLSSKGREQAHALTQHLEGQGITKIYSSPLLRAIETSIILANSLKLDYEITDALREYDCGILEGRSDDEAWQGWQALFDAWVIHKDFQRRMPDGESFNDIRARFMPFIEGLIQVYGDTDTTIACVAHGGLYWMMLPLVLSNVTTQLIRQYGFDYTACIVAESRPSGLVCIKWNGHII